MALSKSEILGVIQAFRQMQKNEKQKSVKFKLLNEFATIPTRGSEQAAGYDLYAATNEPTVIKSHETVKIGTGLSLELPVGTFAGIFARSGIATKRGLRPSNCVGVIDSDYRGEIIVAIHNDSDKDQVIQPKERIAQMILIPYLTISFEETDNLEDSKRGSGGFGDSGKF